MDEATTMMEYLLPVGWADVVRQRDLSEFEARVDLRVALVEMEFRLAVVNAFRRQFKQFVIAYSLVWSASAVAIIAIFRF